MYNRSEILRNAWAFYRAARPVFFAKGETEAKRMFLGHLFAKMLRRSWDEAKKAAKAAAAAKVEVEARAIAQQLVDGLKAQRIGHLLTLTAAERSPRLSGLADGLRMLEYAPWGIRTSQRRAQLNAEVELLEAAEARAAELDALAA